MAGGAFDAWVGRSERRRDEIHAAPMHALRATLDLPPRDIGPGTPLPPLWHWLFFVPTPRASEIGPDGHARRGGFLPPVPLPRRIWAGGRLQFDAPLHVGDEVERVSTVEAIQTKQGRGGELVFVTVRHALFRRGDAAPAWTEWHDVAYREAPASMVAAAPANAQKPRDTPDVPEPAWQRELLPDEVLLFRYSALTFNGHRIHYDRRHVTQAEGYPGLIVHGPLIATLLLDMLQREQLGADVARFEFRAHRPCFDGRTLHLQGGPGTAPGAVVLSALDDTGALAMSASAQLR